MRSKCCLIIFALLVFFFFNSNAWSQNWSEAISVCNGVAADLDIDPVTEHLHLICVQNGTGAYYVELDGSGNILRQETIPGTEAEIGGITYGPSISVDRQGRPYVTFRIVDHYPYYSSYYTYRTANGWSPPITLSTEIYRGWVVRVDVDSAGLVHIARGSGTYGAPAPLEGPVQYFKFLNSDLQATQDNFYLYRADDRLEIDASYKNHVHMILGCPNYPSEGGPVWYWRSFDSGLHWENFEIHHPQALGANGAPDIFVDAAGNVHIIYGSEIDNTVGGTPSVRYARFKAGGTKLRDVAVTVRDEILTRFDTPQGIGSVAASADGKIVMVAYSEDFGARLFVRQSDDEGNSWGDRFQIAAESVPDLGRNRHTIRAHNNNFYIIYPTPNGIKLRYKKSNPNALTISGAVMYDAKVRPLSGASLALTHSGGSSNRTSDANGNYAFSNVPVGNVALVPSKSEDLRDAISGSDALLVLQYLAFLVNTNAAQQYAADVTGDGNVSGSDAQAILRYLAYYSDNIGSSGQWRFIPADTSFALNANAIANFKGYLKGDANLSWGESGMLAKNDASSVALSIDDISLRDDINVIVPIKVEPNGETLNTAIFTISYDVAMLRFRAIENTDMIAGFMVVSNSTEPGKVHFAIAGYQGITNSGDILRLAFVKQSQAESASFDITRAIINDRAVTNLKNGNISFVQANSGVIPERFSLDQNYPNPFNPQTCISFQLPEASVVALKIFNVRGDEICTLIDEKKEAGNHQLLWKGKDASGREAPSGVYVITMNAGEFRTNRKIIKIK